MRRAIASCLVAGASLLGLAGTALAAPSAPAASARPSAPSYGGSYSGAGEITAGTGNGSWCLGVVSIAIKKNSLPNAKLVPCNSAGPWQLKWIVSIHGTAPDYFGEINPVNAADECLTQADNSNNAVLMLCADTFGSLDFKDIAPPLDLLHEHWQIRFYGGLLSVLNPLKSGRRVFFQSSTRTDTQVWQLQFPLSEPVAHARPLAVSAPHKVLGYWTEGLVKFKGEKPTLCLTANEAQVGGTIGYYGCTGEATQQWVAISFKGAVLLGLKTAGDDEKGGHAVTLCIGSHPDEGGFAALYDCKDGPVPVTQGTFITGKLNTSGPSVNRVRSYTRTWLTLPKQGRQIYWDGILTGIFRGASQTLIFPAWNVETA